jgi:hypothetical protein
MGGASDQSVCGICGRICQDCNGTWRCKNNLHLVGSCCEGFADKSENSECVWKERFYDRMDNYLDALVSSRVDDDSRYKWIYEKKDLSKQDAKGDPQLLNAIIVVLLARKTLELTDDDCDNGWEEYIDKLNAIDGELSEDASDYFEDYACNSCEYCDAKECSKCEDEEYERKCREEEAFRARFTVVVVKGDGPPDDANTWNIIKDLKRMVVVGSDDGQQAIARCVIANGGFQLMMFVNDTRNIPNSIQLHADIVTIAKKRQAPDDLDDPRPHKFSK